MAMDHSDEEDYSELVGCFRDFAEDIISRVRAEGDQNCREGMFFTKKQEIGIAGKNPH